MTSQSQEQAVKPAPSTSNRRALGCLSLALVGFMAVVVPPVSKAWRVRRGIQPGMTVEQVLERAEGWNSCDAIAGPTSSPALQLRVGAKAFVVIGEEKPHVFATRSEMASALSVKMGQVGSEWRITLSYLTLVPRRALFDVGFSPAGHVTGVSETRATRLN